MKGSSDPIIPDTPGTGGRGNLPFRIWSMLLSSAFLIGLSVHSGLTSRRKKKSDTDRS